MRKQDLARFALVVVSVLLVDQATKLLISRSLALGESVTIIPGLVHFTLVRNTGMAFGILSGTDLPFKTLVVTLLSLAAMAAVGLYTLRSPAEEKMTRAGLLLILGGAAGNILDRLRLGYVVDFVDVFYGQSHWPAFNVADASICVGVGLLLIDSFRRREAKSPAEAVPASGDGVVEAGQGES